MGVGHLVYLVYTSVGVINQKFSGATIPNRIFPPIFIAFGLLDDKGKKWKLTFGTNHVKEKKKEKRKINEAKMQHYIK